MLPLVLAAEKSPLSHSEAIVLISMNVVLLAAVTVALTMLVIMFRRQRHDIRQGIELQTLMEAEQRLIRRALTEMAKTLKMQHIVDVLSTPIELLDGPPPERDDSDGAQSVDLTQH